VEYLGINEPLGIFLDSRESPPVSLNTPKVNKALNHPFPLYIHFRSSLHTVTGLLWCGSVHPLRGIVGGDCRIYRGLAMCYPHDFARMELFKSPPCVRADIFGSYATNEKMKVLVQLVNGI
jgi:hypothetical protein